MDSIQFPVIGNSIIMALVILVHVFFAFIAVGACCLSAVSKYIANKKSLPFHDRFAREYINFISHMMKLNGVLGVTIVVLTIGLFPEFAKTLYHIFFWFLVLEAGMFFIMMLTGIYYKLNWDSPSKSSHMFSGWVLMGSAILAGFIINAAHAFMLTPGNYFTTKSAIDAAFNPSTLASFSHLIIPCILNASFGYFLYALIKRRKAEGAEKEYYNWAVGFTGKISAIVILFQPLSGLNYLFKLKSVDDALFKKIVFGNMHPFFTAMVTLGTIAIIFALIYLFTKQRKAKLLIVSAIAVYLAFPFGGYTRERARKPFLIRGYMYMSQQIIKDKKAKNVANSITAKNTIKSDTPDNLIISQEEGLKLMDDFGCLMCHTYKGKGGTFGPNLSNIKKTPEELKKFLLNPPEDMPPFDGTEEELNKIARFLSNK